MDNILSILRLGFTEGLIWFPIVLTVGLIYQYLKNIDVSIDGIMIISSISFTLIFNKTENLFLAIFLTLVVALICYSIVFFMIQRLRINDILAGIIFTLVLHSISVVLITESVPLDYKNIDFLSKPIFVFFLTVFIYFLVEFFFRTRLGIKLIVVTDNPNFNSTISPSHAKLSVYLISGIILSLGAIIYTTKLGQARSGGGFEFLITSLSSYLFVDKVIDFIARQLKEKSVYTFFQYIQSPVFKALLGSILFQIVVFFIIFYTSNPIYWKLIFGLILIVLVSNFARNTYKNENRESSDLNQDLILKNIGFTYRDNFKSNKIFENLNLELKKGTNFIWGGNGVGKSTLLKIISGQLTPEEGNIQKNGQNLALLPKHKRKVFTISQVPYNSISSNVSVRYNIIASRKYGLLDLLKLPISETSEFDTTQLAGSLSGGQAQKLNLKLCSIYDPEIILADEPTSGMDKDNFHKFERFINSEAAKGKIIIIVTHDQRLMNSEGNHINLNEII